MFFHLRGLLFLSILLLVGCATSKPIVGPDGTQNHLVSCSTVQYCYEKAREVCKGNYKIINTSAETSGSEGSTSTTVNVLVKCSQ